MREGVRKEGPEELINWKKKRRINFTCMVQEEKRCQPETEAMRWKGKLRQLIQAPAVKLALVMCDDAAAPISGGIIWL